MSATDLKNQGNKHYAARNYEAAVNCYSKAIVSTVAGRREYIWTGFLLTGHAGARHDLFVF